MRVRSLEQLLAYRDLIGVLVMRDLKVRYRRSAMGFMWTMLQPLSMMLVLHIVFSKLFRFDVNNYPVYALSGILFWNFFSQSVVGSMNSLRNSAALIKKLPVPKEVFPIASVMAGIVNFLLALLPLLALLVVTGHPLRWSLLLLPFGLLIATIFVLGAGLLLSPLAAFFYDVVEMVGVGLMMLLYLTPVFYPVSIVPEKYRAVVLYNPLRYILDVFRVPIFEGVPPSLHAVTIASIAAVAMLAIGWAVFRRSASRIVFYL